MSHGISKDVSLSQAAVVVWTRLSLIQPGHDAGVAESVATTRLMRISLTQQTNWTLVLGVQTSYEVQIVSSLVVMLGR